MRRERFHLLYFRLIKALDTSAYLGLVWFTWRFFAGELQWRLAIGAAILSGAWLALTFLRIHHLLKTHFDVLSRLEFAIPFGLGVALSIFALLDTTFAATRIAAGCELAGWGFLHALNRRNRRGYVQQGHGPIPVGCWISPPASVLSPGDLILASGRVAAGLHESVGHGETVIRTAGGALRCFSSYMDRGATVQSAEDFTAEVRRHGHYIVLRLREELSREQERRAEAIVREMIAENQEWKTRVNARRAWLIAHLPVPRRIRERLTQATRTSGYDWLGLFMGRLARHRWTCIGACLELYRRLGVPTRPYGTGLLGFGTTLLDPIMPVRFLADPSFRPLRRDDAAAGAARGSRSLWAFSQPG